MRFTTAVLVGAFAAFAAAQNAFTRTSYTGISAGSPTNITWQPTTQGTVTLKLVQGDPSALTTVATIASSIANSGSFLWTPVTSIVAGSNYALEIIDDANENIFNYTPQFAIASTTTVSSAVSSGVTSSATGSITSAVSSTSGSTASTAGSTTSTSGSSASAASMTTGSSSKITASSSMLTSTKTTLAASSTSASVTTSASKAAGATAAAQIGAGMLGLVGAVMIAL